MDAFQKFIIEGNNLIIAKCTYHKDLVTNKDHVKGGGMWNLNDQTITLYGSSFDFGAAQIEDIKRCIDTGNVWSNQYETDNICDRYNFVYVNVFMERIKLK